MIFFQGTFQFQFQFQFQSIADPNAGYGNPKFIVL